MMLVRVLLAVGLVGLAVAGVYLLDDEPRAEGGDGRGYRIALESPSTMVPGVCPDYRDNAGAEYFWDTHAFVDAREAQISHCGQIDTGPLGEWVVEERSDSQGGYSISAHLGARSHTVTYDWGEFAPSISLNCWRGDEDDRGENEEQIQRDGSFLQVWLWHFGPPQRFYGEPTPVRYQFAEESPSDVALWWGHSAQAEVVVLLAPTPDIPEQDADSHTFAAQMRDAAAANDDSQSGPMLAAETWAGESTSPLGESQGTITFDLAGLERAAFPVFDACGT